MFDYSQIIRNSIEVAKKYKWLWVIAVLLGGSSSLNFSSFRDLSFLNNKNSPLPQNYESPKNVLGQTTSNISAWFASLSPFVLILLVLGILISFIILFTLQWILKSWATAALISGTQLALDGKESDLSEISILGIKNIKNILTFSLIMFLLWTGLIFVSVGGWALVFLIFYKIEVLRTLWIFFGILCGILLFLVALILSAMITIYAERLIVSQKVSPWQAWKTALALSRHAFIPTAVMGIINMIASTTFGCLTTIALLIVLGIPALVVLAPSFTFHKFPSLPVILSLILLFITFIVGLTLTRALIVVFNYANWNQIFKITLENEN